ncbi:2-hydroxyacyl-CoA dehydratase family protein [bacterium]|nr:2-hydroxyacyl-CoA dehydratase family protein [bacterium]
MDYSKKELIGITSTVPVEIIYAGNCTPVDLNNAFITDFHPQILVDEAERIGLPRNTCTWIKGIYSVIRNSFIHTVIGVVQGDCTHMISMLESLLPHGVEFIPFSFPYEKSRQLLRWEMQKIMDYFGVQWDVVAETKNKLDGIRVLAHKIDRMTWEENLVSSADNFYALVNCSDFLGDPENFQKKLETILQRSVTPYSRKELRLGLVGVPTVYTDFYEYLEARDVRVVFHEVARQFAMPDYGKDLLDQNLSYTYPYSFYGRIHDIQEQTHLRNLDGYVHYVQSFCHHQVEDLGMRKHLNLPILTLEGDRVGPLDGRAKTRLDTFIQMLWQKKGRRDEALRH